MSGGLESKGHPIAATGIANIWEVCHHLRGEAGDRQIEGAQVGLAHVIGLGRLRRAHPRAHRGLAATEQAASTMGANADWSDRFASAPMDAMQVYDDIFVPGLFIPGRTCCSTK